MAPGGRTDRGGGRPILGEGRGRGRRLLKKGRAEVGGGGS